MHKFIINFPLILLFSLSLIISSCSNDILGKYPPNTNINNPDEVAEDDPIGNITDKVDLNVSLYEKNNLDSYNNLDNKQNLLYTSIFALPTNKYNYKYNDISYSITNIVSKPANLNMSIDLGNPITKYYVTPKKDIRNNIDFYKNIRALEQAHLNNSELKELNNDYIEKNAHFKNAKLVPDSVRTFNVLKIQEDGSEINRLITAELCHTTPHAYYYIDKNYTSKNSSTEKLVDRIKVLGKFFEDNYKLITDKFNKEADIDNNGKLIYLFSDIGGVFGYFYSADKYGKHIYPTSNYADILYVSLNYIDHSWEGSELPLVDDLKATMVHEFQHMALFDYKYKNNLKGSSIWINEGLSMLSEYYAGLAAPHKGYIQSLFRDTFDGVVSLTNFQNASSYGFSLLFFEYLENRFGHIKSSSNPNKPLFIEKIYNSSYSGIKAIEEATGMEFNQLFTDFMQAILFSGRNITQDKKYNVDSFLTHGYNIKELIDGIYNIPSSLPPSMNIEVEKGVNNKYHHFDTLDYTDTIYPYSFVITKWHNKINNFSFNKEDNVFGIYVGADDTAQTP